MAGQRPSLRWSWCGRVLGSLVVLLAVGDLVLQQAAVSSRESDRTADTTPVTKLAFRMESVDLPSPPARVASKRIDVSVHVGTIQAFTPAAETTRVAVAPESVKVGLRDRKDFSSPNAPDPVRIDRAEGERLLDRAERGDLELARIAWPESPAERSRLDAWLHDCIGVRNALLRGNMLAAAESDVGANASRRFSGLIRRIEGIPAPAEARRLARLRADGGSGVAIRLFPRDFDAVLLSVLSSIGVLRSDARVRYRFDQRLSLEVNGEFMEIPAGFNNRCAS